VPLEKLLVTEQKSPPEQVLGEREGPLTVTESAFILLVPVTDIVLPLFNENGR
jgi:hypothetical protein